MLEQRCVIWSSSFSCLAEMLSSYFKYWKFYCCLRIHPGIPKQPITELQEKMGPKNEHGARQHYRSRQHKSVKTSLPAPVSICSIPRSCILLLLGLLLTGFLTFYSITGLLQRLLFIVSACMWPIMASWLPVFASIELFFFFFSFSQFKVWGKNPALFFLSMLCQKSVALDQEPTHRSEGHGNHGCQGGQQACQAWSLSVYFKTCLNYHHIIVLCSCTASHFRLQIKELYMSSMPRWNTG